MTICMYTCLQGELLTGSAKLLKSDVKICITSSDIFSAFLIASIPLFLAKWKGKTLTIE